MQTIKQNLLNNLEDISVVFDHNNLEKQSLCLSSYFYDVVNAEQHELCVYVDVEVTTWTNEAIFHGDNYSSYTPYQTSEIDTITTTDIFVFKDGCDSDVYFSKEEITEYLNETIKR